jgi:hypothetical protein
VNGGITSRLRLFAAAAVALAGMAVLTWLDPRRAAAGWLVGFVLSSQVPVGSLVLLMIFRLTGGRWGESLRPALEPAAQCMPLWLLLFIPICLALPALYPWAHGTAAEPDVVSHYLNGPFFIGRSVIALGGWSFLAFFVPRIEGRPGQLLAALGLAFHCLIISSVSVDWVLSLEPPFISSSFGASMGITQLIAAMAWAAVRLRVPPEVAGDVGGLLLAFVLGITYVDFMALLVIWYGDLPERVSWFVERARFPWSPLAAGAFIFGSVAPVLALLLSRVRNSAAELQAVGCSALAGLSFYYAYLIIPPFGAFALVPALLAITAIGLLLTALTAGGRAMIESRSLVHGE